MTFNDLLDLKLSAEELPLQFNYDFHGIYKKVFSEVCKKALTEYADDPVSYVETYNMVILDDSIPYDLETFEEMYWEH